MKNNSRQTNIMQYKIRCSKTNAYQKTTTELFYPRCLVLYLRFQTVKKLGPLVVIHIRKLLPNIIQLIRIVDICIA